MIFTVTLNPAIDRVLFLDDLQKGRTNRIQRQVDTLGGKGTHVSINLKLLGMQSTALGVTFGETGRKITQMLRSQDVETEFLHFEENGLQSRTNYLLIEEPLHRCTMVTERGPLLSLQITDSLILQMKTLLKAGDILVLTGDASNVEDTAIYTRLTNMAGQLDVKVFFDSSGPYLKNGLSACPFLVKPNFEEMCFLAGKDLAGEQDVISTMKALEDYQIPVIVMTWSGKGAIAKFKDEFFRVHPVEANVANETGCGDAFLAAMVAGFSNDAPIEEILRKAAAVAAAASEQDLTAGFDPARAAELHKLARVERITI